MLYIPIYIDCLRGWDGTGLVLIGRCTVVYQNKVEKWCILLASITRIYHDNGPQNVKWITMSSTVYHRTLSWARFIKPSYFPAELRMLFSYTPRLLHALPPPPTQITLLDLNILILYDKKDKAWRSLNNFLRSPVASSFWYPSKEEETEGSR